MKTNFFTSIKSIFILTLLGLVIAFSSCKKIDLNKISQSGTWNPNLAFPLGFGEFTVYDILARTDSSDIVIIDGESGAIALLYRGDFFSVSAQDILQLGNYSSNYTVDMADFQAAPAPVFNGQLSYNLDEIYALDFDGDERLDEVVFDGGNMLIEANSTFLHDITILLTFPSILVSQNPLSLQINLSGSGSANFSQNIDLSDAIADFTLNNTTYNTLPIEAEVVLNGNGNAIQGNEIINLSFNLNNLSFNLAKGYLGNQSFNVEDSILIRIFEEVRDGFFQFTDPRVYLELSNSLGLPMQIDFNELKTIVTQTGEALPLTGFPSPLNILSPGTVGHTAVTTIIFDKSNTNNIESIVTPTPKYFYYDADLILNPDGVTGQQNFLSKDSELSVYGEIELPLEGFAYGFTMRDTFEFNTGYDFSDTEQIDYVMFRLFIDNGFPVNIDGQVVFMDENYNVLFTAFDDLEDVALSALVDANGDVISSTEKITDIVLEKDKIDLLDQVAYYQLVGNGKTLSGPQEKVVRFYDFYKTALKLSIQVEGRQDF